MSDERKPRGDTEAKPPGSPRKLLRDLESIRDLLDADEGVDIPVLREIVPPQAAESPAHRPAEAEEAGEAGPRDAAPGPAAQEEVQHDLFEPDTFADRLFDDAWRHRSEAILEAARERADELAACIDPDVDDATLESLHARVDAELPPALEQVVTQALDDLQDRLLAVLETELTRLVEATFGESGDASPAND